MFRKGVLPWISRKESLWANVPWRQSFCHILFSRVTYGRVVPGFWFNFLNPFLATFLLFRISLGWSGVFNIGAELIKMVNTCFTPKMILERVGEHGCGRGRGRGRLRQWSSSLPQPPGAPGCPRQLWTGLHKEHELLQSPPSLEWGPRLQPESAL